MTGHQINSLVGDLVAMAQAMEELPKVKHELNDARVSIDAQQATIQRLELKLMDRSNELEQLTQRIRSLEVERDEAQFHTLEADDRTSRALDFIKATFGNAGSLIQALEPARAEEPVKTATGSASLDEHLGITSEGKPVGESANPLPSASMMADHSANSPTGKSSTSNPAPTQADAPSPSPAPEVAAQLDPTVLDKPAEIGPDASLSGAETTANVSQPTTTPSTQASAADQPFSMPAQAKPFEGRRYSEVVKAGNYPSRDEWEAGGGTVDNWYA